MIIVDISPDNPHLLDLVRPYGLHWLPPSGRGECYLYRFYGDADVLLYIGVTARFPGRWRAHRRTAEWWPRYVQVSDPFPTKAAAERAEVAAIRTEFPLHNQRSLPAWHASRRSR